jgi:putative spermidine/putrescine transport system permease protein
MRRIGLAVFVALVFAFLLLPLVVVVATSVGDSAIMRFPPSAFTLRWYAEIPSEFYDSALTSVIIASGATVLAVLVGTPAALALVRGNIAGSRILNAMFLSPLIIPTIVIGVAGLLFLNVIWDLIGVDLHDTYIGLILAHTSFTTALVIRSTIAAHANFEYRVEEASANLGATPLQTFVYVTLPLIRPGIAAGAVFAFLYSFDELPIALLLGGANVTTLPVKIYTTLEQSLDTWIMAVSAIVIFTSAALILVMQRVAGLQRFLGAHRPTADHVRKVTP